ncbi:GNAT family N-acetyltransferase [Paenibacillus sp. W2I17]|uniref:GNAT family N-acetyltransferase n=1 Tax=Paenibacillus sp. W2I17 TaxID=3042311 RepID=UPI00277E6B6D|nr:GNAT family protein [Paenibacillus sp. W2I17]MDQ0656578.1 RimJ/RimL family protein N-acetyltransferase [Paenibacillus sp. W2I17]
MKYSAERIYVRFWNVDDAALLLDLILEFAKHETEITRIEAGAVPDNTGSIRVLQKAGFKENGSQPVPIQGTLKEHTMFAVDIL